MAERDLRVLAKVFLCFFLVLLQTPAGTLVSGSTLEKSEENTSKYWNSTLVLKKLLDSYDRRIRPGKKGVPVVVLVDMMVANIWAMQEVNMDFTIDIYLRQYWKDERLEFKSVSSDSKLTLSSDINKQIWVPSTYFLATKKAYFHDVTTDNYLLQVKPDGSLFYSMRLTITTSCRLDLRDFPHDTQQCSLSLESYGYQATDVLYVWNERVDNTSAIYLHDDLELPQFEVLGVSKSAKMNKYNIGNHSSLVADFKMKRRIGYFLIDTYIPSTIIVIISWISFWIDPETAPARVALGITTVLTMTTLISSARANLPKVSYVKAIDWYLLLCLIFVFGSILEYTCVTYVISQRKRIKQKMEVLKAAHRVQNNNLFKPKEEIVFSDFPAKILQRNNNNVLKRVMGNNELSSNMPGNIGVKIKSLDDQTWVRDPVIIDRVSRLFFPLSFVGFNVVYWMVYGV